MLDDFVYKLIAERRKGAAEESKDLLTMLLEARDEETGETMSDLQLRDEIMTMILAGHETTANAMAWTLCALSRYPEVGRRVAAEVAGALEGRPPGAEDVPKLPYTTAVIQESMRVFPPVWGMSRDAIEEDEIGGYRVPKGAMVTVSPYLTHRHPELWENPEGFDPGRFAPGEDAGRPRFAYFPFGGGPRLCIGNFFAMLEMQLVIPMIVQRFRLDLVPGHPVEYEAKVTGRPRYGIRMALRPAIPAPAPASTSAPTSAPTSASGPGLIDYGLLPKRPAPSP